MSKKTRTKVCQSNFTERNIFLFFSYNYYIPQCGHFDSQNSDFKQISLVVIKLKMVVIWSILLFLVNFGLPPLSLNLIQISLQNEDLQNKRYAEIATPEQYFALLDSSDATHFKNEFEAEFLLLLKNDEEEQYAQLTSLNAQKSFIKKYWQRYNPNPVLEENDRLLDHLRRRIYARKHFAVTTPPYFDDRGKYYVKYGKPKFRYQDFGGQRSMESLISIPFKYYSVKPNESWSYVNVAPNYVVHFVEKDNAYREIESLKQVIEESHRSGRVVWYWFDLLKRRFWMSSLVTETVNDIEQLERELALTNGPRATIDKVGTPEVRAANMMLRNLQQAEYEMELAAIDAPPVTYDPIHAKNKLDFSTDIAQFRGDNGQTQVEIAFLSPIKQYMDRSHPAERLNVEYSCLVSDQKLDSLDSGSYEIHYPAPFTLEENLDYAVGLISVEAYPQSVELAMQVKNLNNDEVGFTQEYLNLRNFDDSTPILSDLQLLTEVTDKRQAELLPTKVQQGLQLAPYPYQQIRKSAPLFCYFEAYNLSPEYFENQEFRITYKVFRDESRESTLKKLFTDSKQASISIQETRPLTEENIREIIELDLSKLANGPYKLDISLQDNSGNFAAIHSQKDIYVAD